jgi:hypothetical protein
LEKPKSRKRIIVERLVLGHLLSYPVAGLWLFGMISLIILTIGKQRLLALTDEEAKKLILSRDGWLGLAAYIAVHIASLPWAFGKNVERNRKIFFVCFALLFLAGLLGGGAGWIYLLYFASAQHLKPV